MVAAKSLSEEALTATAVAAAVVVNRQACSHRARPGGLHLACYASVSVSKFVSDLELRS